MAEIDAKIVEELVDYGFKVKRLKDGSIIWEGPYLKKRYFDNYTECLKENIAARRNDEYKKLGLNKYGQTKEQEENLNKRIKLAKEKKDRAEVLLQGAKMME